MIIPSSFPYCFPKTANSDYGEGGLAAQPLSIPAPRPPPRPLGPNTAKGGGSAQFVQFSRRAGRRLPGWALGATPSLGRASGQHFAHVLQVGLQRLGPHVRTRETQSVVCKQPLSSSGLRQLQPSPPFPRARPLLGPRSPSAVPRPRSYLQAGRGSAGSEAQLPAPGWAGAAGGGGPGRHGPQPSALGSAGPLRES